MRFSEFKQPENPTEEHNTGLVRHTDLWFPDGSVVLRAERTLFRVHMSQLSRHSAFFRDLFSLPQPVQCDVHDRVKVGRGGIEEESEAEGCPVVFLYDAAEDAGNLLAALYDGPNFGNNDPEDFRMVAGILRLSTKYVVDSLRAKALAHLTTAWPLTLKGWDAREDISRTFEAESSHPGAQRYPSPTAIINLSREVNASSLLPSAFYDLSRYSFSQIFETSDDDSLVSFPNSYNTLSAFDMQKLALGKESTQHAITALIQAMGNSPHHHYSQHHPSGSISTPASQFRKATGRTCVSAAACRKDFSELVDLATQHYLFDRERGCSDPLYVAEELGQLKSAEFSECKACAKALETWAARERERMWKMIPVWFRLDAQ